MNAKAEVPATVTSSKKRIVILCSLLMVLALAAGGTLAYFYDTETITNKFALAGSGSSSGTVDIALAEPNWVEENGLNLSPGNTVAKDPTVTNNSESAVYMRVVVELLDKATGDRITDDERAEMILSMIVYGEDALTSSSGYTASQIAEFSTVNSAFTQDADRSSRGLYYYNYTANNGLMATGATATLFNYVLVPSDWEQDDLDTVGDFDIVVTAQAIQSEGMTDASTAFATLDDELSLASA